MENVSYLEIEDINSKGNLKSYVNNGKPILMIGLSSTCPYCVKATPAFQEFANTHPHIQSVAILINGEKSERNASKWINKWDNKYRGVPWYAGFDSKGKFKKVHNGKRDTFALSTFSKG